jgi:hypothetical protein
MLSSSMKMILNTNKVNLKEKKKEKKSLIVIAQMIQKKRNQKLIAQTIKI